MIDMEAAPLNYVISSLEGNYTPLFIVSDSVDPNFNWINGTQDDIFQEGLEKGLALLAEN